MSMRLSIETVPDRRVERAFRGHRLRRGPSPRHARAAIFSKGAKRDRHASSSHLCVPERGMEQSVAVSRGAAQVPSQAKGL